MILPMKAGHFLVDTFPLHFDDSLLSSLFWCQLKKSTSNTLNHTHSNFTLTHIYIIHFNLTMPGPDPRRTKPSAYTIPKAGNSKPVGTRPPLHSGASAAAKDDNPRPLTHQEVRRSKAKNPVVSRHSARLPGTRRSPGPALRSRVASLKRPIKYDPKSQSNLTQLGSKAKSLVAREIPPLLPEGSSPVAAVVISDSEDSDAVLLSNDFDGEDNDESIEAIQEAIDQMGVEQSDFEMAVNSGSEYAYLLAGTEDEKKRAESVIQHVPIF